MPLHRPALILLALFHNDVESFVHHLTLPRELDRSHARITTGRSVLRATQQQQQQQQVPEKLRLANQKVHDEVWASRRSMTRSTLSAARAFRTARIAVTPPPTEDAAISADEQLAEDGKGALVISAVGVAVAAATIRVGGRAALVSLLGLDFGDDEGVQDSVESFLAFFNDLGPAKYAYFFSGWVIAKTFCVDFLSVVLALASGVVFGGVVNGALISATCATVASVVGFQLARTKFTSSVAEQLEKRPALRALERVVSDEGFKTVVTLRLAPVLPIPLGAYNYAYGVTSLPLPTFMAGTFLGSLKPYLLDSYLGVFGKSVVDGQGDAGGDLALVGTFFVVVLVGTFASQVAGRTWDELNTEAQRSLENSAGNQSGAGENDDIKRDGLEWLDLWGVERSSLPQWLRSWQEKDQAVKTKIRKVVQQEWEYMDSREAVLAAEVENGNARQNSAALLPQDPQFVPPGPPLLGEDGRRFDVGAYVRESTVFPFVLFESFWEYSNPKLDGGEGAGASRHGNYDAAGLVEEEQR